MSEVLTRLRALPTAAISDALDRAGIPGALHGIAPLSDGFRAVGPAFTVRYAPIGDGDGGGTVGDFLGGIMTEVAALRGISGTVINGVCRDVSASLARDYPLFSRGRYMRTGKDRVRLVAVGERLIIAGVSIRPDALVCADADGAVVVPAEQAERVAEDAAHIDQLETEISKAVRAGSTLRAAREELGYHDLQRGRP